MMSSDLLSRRGSDTTIEHHASLTSAEVANLWTQYMTDSLALQFISYALVHVKDDGVRSVLTLAQQLSETHLKKVERFLGEEGYSPPQGFTADDIINPDAPPLFTDIFLLDYFYVMTLLGLTSYAGALGTSTRADQRQYFTQCNAETMDLYNQIIDVMLQKGLLGRPPSMNPPQQVDYVKEQSYMAGWLGKQRPLNAIEVSSLYFNMVKIEVKIVLEKGFCQVVQCEEIRKYLQRGAELCEEQFHVLGETLMAEDLPIPRKWTSEITNATRPAFSDKLMLFHVVTLVAASAAFYGAGLSVSQRRDIATNYVALTAQMGLYAENGVNMLIRKGWLEQAPSASDREALAKQK